ncbi:acylphosphatase [Secundilactobacillus malefermentans]|nr:acylphosphatase [Secundilactobacillus malefermentans]
MNLVKAYQITVYGRVQGVGFRWSTVRLAEQLSIVGTVKNQRDGSVQIVAQGKETDLTHFLQTVETNLTPFAKVANLTKMAVPVKNWNNFRIID